MRIDRRAFVPETSIPVAQLRELCVGCKDCKGACMELLQMGILPDILSELREDRR